MHWSVIIYIIIFFFFAGIALRIIAFAAEVDQCRKVRERRHARAKSNELEIKIQTTKDEINSLNRQIQELERSQGIRR